MSGSFQNVQSIDIVDERAEKNINYKFSLYDGKKIPFKNHSFDVVVLNHVLEHVHSQKDTLKEIKRVMSAKGICYVAVPNKWAFIEPHFNFPFLSWMPQSLSDFFVQLTRKDHFYNVKPLSRSKYVRLLRKLFFVTDLTEEVACNINHYEDDNSIAKSLIRYIPKPIIKKVLFFSPSFIFILQNKEK